MLHVFESFCSQFNLSEDKDKLSIKDGPNLLRVGTRPPPSTKTLLTILALSNPAHLRAGLEVNEFPEQLLAQW